MAATYCPSALVSDMVVDKTACDCGNHSVVDETAFDCGCSTELSTADLSEDRDTWDRHLGDSTSEFSDKSVPQSPVARECVEPTCTSDWGGVGLRLSRVFHDFDLEEDSGLEDFGSPAVVENIKTSDYGLSMVFKSFAHQGDSDVEEFGSDPLEPVAMMNSGLSRVFQNFQHEADDYDEVSMRALPPNIPPPPGLTRDASAAAAAVALLGNMVLAVASHRDNLSRDSSEDTEFESIESTYESEEEESCSGHEESEPLVYTRQLSRVFAQFNVNEDADTAIIVDFAPDPMPNCKPPSFRPPPGLTRDASMVAAAGAAKVASFGNQRTPWRTARPPR